MILKRLLSKARTTRHNIEPRIISVPNRQAGVLVTHDTALQTSAVFACVRVIAEDIAQLPWHAYIRTASNERQRLADSQVEKVLDRRPNPELSPFSFRETLVSWALTWGNGYAEIVRDNAGRVAELWPIQPDRVDVRRDKETGRLLYEVSNANGPKTFLNADDVFHLHGLGFDGVTGYSTVSYAARSIGLNISLEEFGAAFFGNGATLGGVITIPEEAALSAEAKKNLKTTFNKANRGPYRSHGIEVLDAGMDYKPMGVEPNKGQFTESRQNQVEEICRWFRVPPHKVGHLLRMTFNNVEQLSINYVQESLLPWIRRLEQEADYKLYGAQNRRQYTKINVDALLRGDQRSRIEFYRGMWDIGAFSTNDILELEDRNGIGPDGDKRLVQLNLTTLEKAGEKPEQPQQPLDDQPFDVTAHSRLIQHKATLLLNREMRRFDDLCARYPDRDEYIERVTGYLGGIRNTIQREIGKRLDSLCSSKGIRIDTGYAAKVYASNHIDLSRVEALKIFDKQPTIDIASRAERIADQLINSVKLLELETHV